MTQCTVHIGSVVEYDERRVDGYESPLCRVNRILTEIREEVPELLIENSKGELIINDDFTESMEDMPKAILDHIEEAESLISDAEYAMQRAKSAYRDAKKDTARKAP